VPSRARHSRRTSLRVIPSCTSDKNGLIFTKGPDSSWDEAGVGHPVVRYYLGDNETRWFMWYTGKSSSCHDVDSVFPSSGSVGLAISEDGLNWSRGEDNIEGARGARKSSDVGRILTPNPDWWTHDTAHLSVSDVQLLSTGAVSGEPGGVYWCFYGGGDFEEVEVPEKLAGDNGSAVTMEGLRVRPGLAMSQDGRNFARIEGEHHTGALFDVGEAGDFDELFIAAPQVVAAGPKDMRMYYHSFDKRRNRYVVGLATSTDGFKWVKRGPVFSGSEEGFDSMGAAARCVVRDIDTKQYFMFYEGVDKDTGVTSIGLAVSQDGISGWERHDRPVVAPSGSGWDSGSVGTPWAVSMSKGRWRLYYSGRESGSRGAWDGIGVAMSSKEEDAQKFCGAPVTFEKRAFKFQNE
jgi:predicted GH43/DUF377 family glycosyl hydrolase